ncbi:MAG: hypothetical protein OEV94_02390 [Deltaproteobacteria bacterium]|nr:hypothetical protein [Deltaproteobacteria bacterium]
MIRRHQGAAPTTRGAQLLRVLVLGGVLLGLTNCGGGVTPQSSSGPRYRVTKVLNYNAGMISAYYQFVYTQATNKPSSINFYIPIPGPTPVNPQGPDGIWFTSDDIITSHAQVTYTASGEFSRIVDFDHYNPATGVPYTTPVISQHSDYTYDVNNNQISQISYNGPGPDGLWFNADDVIVSSEVYTNSNLNAQGKPLHIEWISTFGGFTTKTCQVVSYNAGGQVTLTDYYSQGTDLTCFSPDDFLVSYNQTAYNSISQILSDISFSGPGTDGLWHNTDDAVSSYTKPPTLDASGYVTNLQYWTAGADAIRNTADDSLSSEDIYQSY